MRFANFLRLSAICCALPLASCGGSSGGGGTTITPTPTPTPVPTPTPTPPPPAAATGRVVSTFGDPCAFYIFTSSSRDVSNPQTTRFFCSSEGRLGSGVTSLRPETFGPLAISSFKDNYGTAYAVDGITYSYVVYVAPLGSLIYSPATSLTHYAGNQTVVKRALGLASGSYAFAVDRDLTMFDPVDARASSDTTLRQDGGRAAAANLRATIAAQVPTFAFGPQDFYDTASPSFDRLGAYLAAHDAYLFDDAGMTAWLTSQLPTGRSYRSEVIAAGAHLVNAYVSAIGAQIDDTDSAAQFTLGIKAYLRAELYTLFATDTAAAAAHAAAITPAQITNATLVLRQRLSLPSTARFIPGPNFFQTTASSITVGGQTAVAKGDMSTVGGNDLFFGAPVGEFGLHHEYGSSIFQSVSVPSENRGKVSANFDRYNVVISALGGFRGITYVNYQAHQFYEAGETQAGRIYVYFQ